MGRILALDYGRKRVGVAVTDPLKISAHGLDTIPAHQILDFLDEYFKKESIEKVVIGFPIQLNNQPSEASQYVKPFIRKFKEKFPDTDVELMDERFTSSMAQAAMLEGGLKKKARQNKALVDKISATIILQSFLEKSGH